MPHPVLADTAPVLFCSLCGAERAALPHVCAPDVLVAVTVEEEG